jgi:uncharacterized protein YhdP
VEIASLSADWPGLHPTFRIGGLTIKDAAGQPALTLDRVEAEPAWVAAADAPAPAPAGDRRPDLAVRRLADGQIFVAGLPVKTDGGRATCPMAARPAPRS